MGYGWWQLRKKKLVAWCDPRAGAEDRLSPSHKIREETYSETSLYDTQKFTILRHKNWSCKYKEDMYCDSDDKNVILFSEIDTFHTCQADVNTKMTVGMVMCITQNGEVCTVGIPTCLSCEEAPRWMSMIWFSYNTLKSVDEQISTKETCELCAEQYLLQHCFQLSGWRINNVTQSSLRTDTWPGECLIV